jgi:hypothetical protein
MNRLDTHLLSGLETKDLTCDILVAGGGPAGVPCALAAARLGARVILCQDRPVLGGNASSEVRMHIVGANGMKNGVPLESEVREGGIIEEIRLEQCRHNPQRSASMMDLTLYDLCRSEPDLNLFLNTTVTGVEMSGDTIAAVIAERQSTQERFLISARVFVDCTGDGRLGFEAGSPHMWGRESKGDYGEALAVDQADRKTLGSSLLLTARRHDRPMPFKAPAWARRFKPDDFRFRPFARTGSDMNLDYGFWWVEWGGCLDTIKDNEHIRDELLSIILGVWDFIKNKSDADASHWALDWFGFLPGKRESRRFIGQHVLSEHELFESHPFEDAIAYGGWPIDTHPPEGVDAPGELPCEQNMLPLIYSIPLRSCVSPRVRNLMFAGRNISATHIAFASTRVMATCATVGQGVGTAAAFAVREGVAPTDLPGKSDLIRSIQQRLLRDDCYLVGRLNEDPDDLARAATVSASSEQPEGSALNILSGQTRSVHGTRIGQSFGSEIGHESADASDSYIHAPSEWAYPGTHRWMSDPTVGFPAWIELAWKEAISVREIQLIFDSEMHRLFTLTQSSGYAEPMDWGVIPPSLVRDYVVSAEGPDGDFEWARENDNYQRRRVHTIAEPRRINRLRVEVKNTHGLNHARIFEIRAYGVIA